MAAQLGTHPSADALRGFAVGQLDDRTSAAIMSHLDSCPDCCRAVVAVPGDDFLDRLRQAHGPGARDAGRETSEEGSDTLGSRPSSRTSRPSSPIAHLPPELANNPQYEVLRELGRGGMGVVYLAKNKLLDRLEVLKVVNQALLDRPGAVERFLRQIRSAAKLNHVNVVAAYSAIQSGEVLAFAMEYVEGEDLAQLVQTQGPLPVDDAGAAPRRELVRQRQELLLGDLHSDPPNASEHVGFRVARVTKVRRSADDNGFAAWLEYRRRN